MNKYHAIAIFTVELIIAATFMQVCFAVEPAEVNSAINQADLGLTSAFVAVERADKAGANVAELINKLGVAGDLLSEADTEFRAGNFETASSLAAASNHALEGIAIEAGQLEAEGEKAKTNTLLLTVAGSSIGLVSLVALGIMGWWVLRKRF